MNEWQLGKEHSEMDGMFGRKTSFMAQTVEQIDFFAEFFVEIWFFLKVLRLKSSTVRY